MTPANSPEAVLVRLLPHRQLAVDRDGTARCFVEGDELDVSPEDAKALALAGIVAVVVPDGVVTPRSRA